MKKCILLGLVAFSILALAPTKSSADDFRVYVDPGYEGYGPYYDRDDYWDHHHHHWNEDDWYRWRRWHRHHHHHHDDDWEHQDRD
jgi:hypothetical protein